MRCVSPVAGAVRGTTARLSLGRKRRGDMRRFLPFCDPCAVWILEAASPIEVNNSVCIRAKHGLCIPAALLRGVGEVGFRGRSMAEPGTAARCRSTRSKCAHPHGRLPELRRRARPRLPSGNPPPQHPRPSPHAVGSDGQSCFPAGLRGPVFLGFSLVLINSGIRPPPPCPSGPCPTPTPSPCLPRAWTWGPCPHPAASRPDSGI